MGEEVKKISNEKIIQKSEGSKIEQPKPTQDHNRVPKKKSVFLVVLYSIITLGIYPALWYMEKSTEFYYLGTEKKLKRVLPLMLLIFEVILISLLITLPLTITTDMGRFYQNLTTLQVMIISGIILSFLLRTIFCLINAFHSRKVINQALANKGSKTKISGTLTLIFTHFYLQYEINRILEDTEEEKRTAPWVVLGILILLMVASIFM